MNPKLSTILAGVLVLAGALGHFGIVPRIDAGDATKPERPREELASLVAPVTAAVKGATPADSGRLTAFYAAMAEVISRDQGKVIQTTGQFRETYRRAGLLMFQRTGMNQRYPALADAIDKVLVSRIALDDVPLDAAKQAAAIDALRAIAWACYGGQ